MYRLPCPSGVTHRESQEVRSQCGRCRIHGRVGCTRQRAGVGELEDYRCRVQLGLEPEKMNVARQGWMFPSHWVAPRINSLVTFTKSSVSMLTEGSITRFHFSLRRTLAPKRI